MPKGNQSVLNRFDEREVSYDLYTNHKSDAAGVKELCWKPAEFYCGENGYEKKAKIARLSADVFPSTQPQHWLQQR